MVNIYLYMVKGLRISESLLFILKQIVYLTYIHILTNTYVYTFAYMHTNVSAHVYNGHTNINTEVVSRKIVKEKRGHSI